MKLNSALLPTSFILLFFLTLAAPVQAQVTNGQDSMQDETAHPFEIQFILLAATDFRFRGISYSDGKPVFQPEITLSHKSGIYVDLWASNIAEYGGATTEVDVTLGVEREFGPLSVDFGGTASFFPGGSNTNFVELYAIGGLRLGSATVELQTYYAPVQKNIGGEDNVYVALAGNLPLRTLPVTLHASFGVEDGAFGDAKRDWMVGASGRLAGFDICLRYLDSDRTGNDPSANATAVLTLSRTFVFPRRKVEHSGCPSW